MGAWVPVLRLSSAIARGVPGGGKIPQRATAEKSVRPFSGQTSFELELECQCQALAVFDATPYIQQQPRVPGKGLFSCGGIADTAKPVGETPRRRRRRRTRSASFLPSAGSKNCKDTCRGREKVR